MITVKFWNTLDLHNKQNVIEMHYHDAEVGIEGRNVLLDNIHVLDQFIKFALPIINAGRHVGSRCLVERIRYETTISDSDITFKVNNNLSKYLSRITMAIFPEFNGFFEKRALK